MSTPVPGTYPAFTSAETELAQAVLAEAHVYMDYLDKTLEGYRETARSIALICAPSAAAILVFLTGEKVPQGFTCFGVIGAFGLASAAFLATNSHYGVKWATAGQKPSVWFAKGDMAFMLPSEVEDTSQMLLMHAYTIEESAKENSATLKPIVRHLDISLMLAKISGIILLGSYLLTCLISWAQI